MFARKAADTIQRCPPLSNSLDAGGAPYVGVGIGKFSSDGIKFPQTEIDIPTP